MQLVEGSVGVDEFRAEFQEITEGQSDPMLDLATDEAEDYLRAFERLSLFKRRLLAPDPDEVASRAESLRIIAQALKEDWTLAQLNRRLRWV